MDEIYYMCAQIASLAHKKVQLRPFHQFKGRNILRNSTVYSELPSE